MTEMLLLLSLMLGGLQTFPDCFETRCSRFVNILTFPGGNLEQFAATFAAVLHFGPRFALRSQKLGTELSRGLAQH